MKGKKIVDDRVWITQAHYPMTQPWNLDFNSKKLSSVFAISPSYTSFASLVNTMCQSEQPEFSYLKNFPVWWDWWVRFNADTHAKYFKTLLKECAESKVPFHIVRYEDLVTEAKKKWRLRWSTCWTWRTSLTQTTCADLERWQRWALKVVSLKT